MVLWIVASLGFGVAGISVTTLLVYVVRDERRTTRRYTRGVTTEANPATEGKTFYDQSSQL